VWVFEIFLSNSLDIQQFILKLAMKSNALDAMVKPINANSISHLWCTLLTSKVIFYFVKRYFKLVVIAMVQVFGSVEDDKCFSVLALYKYKLCNQFTNNLGLVVEKFYNWHNFAYANAFDIWCAKCPQYEIRRA
jgi:hypothetical protein